MSGKKTTELAGEWDVMWRKQESSLTPELCIARGYQLQQRIDLQSDGGSFGGSIPRAEGRAGHGDLGLEQIKCGIPPTHLKEGRHQELTEE